MNRIFVLLFCFFGLTSMDAQIHEVGIFIGGSNYIGDVGPTDHVAPKEPAFGVLYKWNRSARHSWRFSYTQSEIASNDRDAKTPGRTDRGYSFKNSIKEVSLGLEFNFLDFDLHDFKTKVTPYVYSGVSYFAYDELFVVAGQTKEDYTDGALAIPMTVGLKSNITPHFIIGIEVGARYTFTDNLDGNNPKNENFETLKFGNINNNDWYVFTGLTLTYTFGNKPCFCAE